MDKKTEVSRPHNLYCQILGINVPRLEEVNDRTDASSYALLLVALLERGEAMTLEEVARRFEEAGVAHYSEALRSLQRCRPGTTPIYRQGGRIERMLPVPWVHDAEHTLRDLKRKAYEHDLDIEAHLGESAVSLDAPWSNTHRLRVERYDRSRYLLQLRDWGAWVNDDDVFLARLVAPEDQDLRVN